METNKIIDKGKKLASKLIANDIYSKHYMSIYDKGVDLSNECIISIISKEASLITVNSIILSLGKNINHDFWDLVKFELENK